MNEANRLLLTAMQSSAINPVTGMIDIDLINTGISAVSRQTHNDLVREVRPLMSKEVKSGKVARFYDLYRTFLEQYGMVFLYLFVQFLFSPSQLENYRRGILGMYHRGLRYGRLYCDQQQREFGGREDCQDGLMQLKVSICKFCIKRGLIF